MPTFHVTGFGPFGNIVSNPSALLAEASELPYTVLPVAYGPVNEFLLNLDPASFDVLLLLGVNASADRLHVESTAHNRISRTVDNEGVRLGPKIVRAGPWRLTSTLWQGKLAPRSVCRDTPELKPSGTAGSYLCNFAYYRALQYWPEKRVGFVHVPSIERIPIARQRQVLASLLGKVQQELN